jgi:hypothetical protein
LALIDATCVEFGRTVAHEENASRRHASK